MSYKYRAVKETDNHWVLPRTGDMKCEVHAFLSQDLYDLTGENVWQQAVDSASYEGAVGIDVHKPFAEQSLTGTACLACSHRDGEKMTTEDWRTFQSLMQEHHDVTVPDEVMPDYLKGAK